MKGLKVEILGYVKKKDLFDTEEKYYLVTNPPLCECGPFDRDEIARLGEDAINKKIDFDEYVEVSYMNYVKKTDLEMFEEAMSREGYELKEVSRF